MKRNIIRVALLAVFAFVAGYGVYTSQKETSMSDLAMANVEMANVEALASGEDGNYDCDAPYTATCSYEGSVRVPGVKR